MGDTTDHQAEPRAFQLGVPSLICRWHLAHGKLPLENRHLRALSQRGVDPALLSWAKQHIEWTLADGAFAHPDGVLMLVIDEDGQAAMSVGPYEALSSPTADTLYQRALQAEVESARTSVAPETLWFVQAGVVHVCLDKTAHLAGATSLVLDLLATRKKPVSFEGQLSDGALPAAADELFLVSDEHGVVAADGTAGTAGTAVQLLTSAFEKLRASFAA